jgi:hypothetical protein
MVQMVRLSLIISVVDPKLLVVDSDLTFKVLDPDPTFTKADIRFRLDHEVFFTRSFHDFLKQSF